MKAPLCAAVYAAMFAFLIAASPSFAQEKTVKQCQDEWRANKAENQAKGIKEKDYVAQCRGTAAATTPKPAPAATPRAAPAAGAAPAGQVKTAKECRAEWQANKADNQAKGITEKDYVAKCRAGAAAAAPAAAPSAPAAAAPAAAPAPARAPAPAPKAATPPRAATTAVTGAGQYPSESEAKSHCPTDTIVWVNLKSKIYHFSGAKNYGTTEQGTYMCEKEALAQGDRASKAEKHP